MVAKRYSILLVFMLFLVMWLGSSYYIAEVKLYIADRFYFQHCQLNFSALDPEKKYRNTLCHQAHTLPILHRGRKMCCPFACATTFIKWHCVVEPSMPPRVNNLFTLDVTVRGEANIPLSSALRTPTHSVHIPSTCTCNCLMMTIL